MSKNDSDGGGIGCIPMFLVWVVLLALVGFGFYEMEPRAAVQWAFQATCIGLPGILAIALLFILMLGD